MEPEQRQHSPPKSPSSSPPQNHHHHACANCGSPTPSFPPPPSGDIDSPSPPPPPGYIPIRVSAVNLPPNTHSHREAIILSPVPQPQQVPPLPLPHHSFAPVPAKHIHSSADLRRFHSSFSGRNFLGFVASLSHSVRGLKISDPCHVSPTLSSVLAFLQNLIDYVRNDFPPLPSSSRYGNLAYRSWHSKMVQHSKQFMLQLLREQLSPVEASEELSAYLADSFGNYTRIDYGTGHETNFAAWLYCLARLGLIKEEDYQAVVLRVFVKYLDLMRTLQLDYSLEPAGSHGVWGLDDYNFLPFVFGSAQLVGHKYMKPKSIHNVDILESFSNEYLYLSCVVFTRKMKKGVFAEHSPLLDDISGVPNWEKVNSGLLKMYRAEVLEKVPIMQHFLFGSIIKWE